MPVSDGGGHLRAVPEGDGPAEAPSAPPRASGSGGRARIVLLSALALGLLVAGFGWFTSQQRATALQAKLDAVSGQLRDSENALRATTEELAARRSHFARVKSSVDALAVELDGLRSVIREEPKRP